MSAALVLLMLPCLPLAAIELGDSQPSVNLTGAFEYLEDPDGSLSLDQARTSSDFQRASSDNITRGYTQTVLWLRMTVHNRSSRQDWLLEFDYPLLDRIDTFFFDGGEAPYRQLRVGDLQPFTERPISHRNFLIPLELDPGETVEIYVRVETKSSMQVRPTLHAAEQFFADELSTELFFGLIYGVMILMALYNAFLFVSVRDPAYLGYIFAVVTACIFIMSLNGHAFQYLIPNHPHWANAIVPLSSALWMVGTALFTQLFLDLATFSRNLWRMMNVIIVMAIGASLLALFADYRLAIRVTTGMALINGILILSAGIISWARGNRSARFFTLAWIVYGFGTMMLITSRFGVIPDNFITHHSATMGLLLEIVILSFALSDKYRILNQELKGYAHSLESKVAERTTELEQANRDLEHLAQHDSLTELPNRRYFDLTLRREWQRHQRNGRHIGLLVCDVDEFKQINDFFGHAVGDDCLKAVAVVLRESARRPSDLPARLGGDEFAMILPETEQDGALSVAEKIAEAVRDLALPQSPEATHRTVTVSVGVASIIPNPDNDQEVIFRIADRGTYRSKSAGRDQAQLGPLEDTQAGALSTQSSSSSSS